MPARSTPLARKCRRAASNRDQAGGFRRRQVRARRRPRILRRHGRHLSPRCSAKEAGRNGGFFVSGAARAGASTWAACRSPIVCACRFLVAGARAASSGSTLPDGKDPRHRCPRRHQPTGQNTAAQGTGHARHQGPSRRGDAYVEIHVDPHPLLRSPRDNDIHVEFAGDADRGRCWAAGSACRRWAGPVMPERAGRLQRGHVHCGFKGRGPARPQVGPSAAISMSSSRSCCPTGPTRR